MCFWASLAKSAAVGVAVLFAEGMVLFIILAFILLGGEERIAALVECGRMIVTVRGPL